MGRSQAQLSPVAIGQEGSCLPQGAAGYRALGSPCSFCGCNVLEENPRAAPPHRQAPPQSAHPRQCHSTGTCCSQGSGILRLSCSSYAPRLQLLPLPLH